SVSDLVGAKGYVVKFIKDGVVVYAVKRSTSTWKTSYPKKFVNMVFKNGELKGVENNAFSIEKNFDFYVINDTAFIANKKGFESS
ncbi:Kiwa anti-phage protein KwaB-like domain-containing protein, partial [Vibrio anguillarum]